MKRGEEGVEVWIWSPIVGVVAAFSAWVLAQQVGGSDLNIVTLVTQIGFSGIFLWQWLDATKERRRAQTALEDLFERLLPVLEEATSTLERVQAGMEKQVERAERLAPSPEDMAYTIRRLENVITDFHREIDHSIGRDAGVS